MTSGPTKAQLEEQLKELEPKAAELEQRLAEAEAKRDEYLGNLQRLAADFDNYRKRVTRDQESLVARAHERLVRALLPVLDDLERALDAACSEASVPSDGDPGLQPPTIVEDGVRLVARQLREVLEREGLEEIPTDGQFDPHVHEALLSQPSEADEGAIVQVLQKGYRLGDRVIRPARVAISQGLAKTE